MEWEFSQDSDGDGKFMMSGRALGNVRNRLGKGDIDGALAIYVEGANEIGRELIAEFSSASRQTQKHIANLFYRSGEFMRAAACAELLGEWVAAGRAYESASYLEDAARCYARAGDSDRAEALAQKASSVPRPVKPGDKLDLYHDAEANELAGKYAEAAELYKRAGHRDRAQNALAKIPRASKETPQAALIASDLQVERGQIDQAIETLKEALAEERVVKNAVLAEVAYRLAILLQQKGQRAPAEAAFAMIVAFDPNYKDVTQRMMDTSLAGGRTSAKANGPPGGPSVRRREIHEGKKGAKVRPGALGPSVVGVVRGAPSPDAKSPSPSSASAGDPVARALEEERRLKDARAAAARAREEPDDDDSPPRAAQAWVVTPLSTASEPPPEPAALMPRSMDAPRAQSLDEPEESTNTQFEKEQAPEQPNRKLPREIEASIEAIRRRALEPEPDDVEPLASISDAADERTEARSMLSADDEPVETDTFESDESTHRGDEHDAEERAPFRSPQFRGRELEAGEMVPSSSPLSVSEDPEPLVVAGSSEVPSEPAASRQNPREPSRARDVASESPRVPAPEAVPVEPIHASIRSERDPADLEAPRLAPLRAPLVPRVEPAAERVEPRPEPHRVERFEPREAPRRDVDPPSLPALAHAKRKRRMLDPFAALNRELGLAIDPASSFGVEPAALDVAVRLPMFEELSKVQLAELLEIGDEVEYRAGHVISSRGHSMPGLVILLEGRTAPADAGPALGAFALFDEYPALERVVAVDNVRALLVPRSRFLDLAAAHPRRVVPILSALTRLLLREVSPFGAHTELR
ncbi:MAG: hypothetical protein HYV07_15365 [Deltaproteobacteria bacterium]|nr:hypothetical protein [Deltaproteobacteria bacterium]